MANKNNNRNNQNDQNMESTDLVVARLALMGTLLTTLGDGLSAIAAGIALQELENNPPQQTQTSQNHHLDQSKQIEQLQRQVDYLIRKIDKR